LGLTKISADVREGSRRDAILYAVGANASHGLKWTNRDKPNAVMVLLKDFGVGPAAGCPDGRTAEQIAAASTLIRQSDERCHGLTVWLSTAAWLAMPNCSTVWRRGPAGGGDRNAD